MIISFIALLIVGYVEIGPNQCQLEYFKDNQIYEIYVPCDIKISQS